ncbi:GNAT family N-acetyltransferase [Staphylococcus delphini]|uniref:GNAT family N-acetyltransferase n=1 Tax=Staphylococcus delphini TaxID=53344 RepID=A0AAQ0D613_9STAP|nr:GNAT family N-acetyltransferase [Staphylococcus delphini]MDE9752388.1 GNAT family N-acetyltransferase [Staphylococcus delphini]MDE9789342.1 GNAT family N-acetyltransferase [Staphylococcus delphini]MDE9791542.1 GNAT family N-acetyltransferase [Staphylococcus delphini]MDE9793874.1 GNAT family N-acetyltransferase [Staphylococcus delphini]MDE9796237.1 GNAT family N-acetyltransferase [Staphylococcus delphini]
MILLTYEDSDYIHRVAEQHVKLLQSDPLMRTQGTQMEIALYEEMIAHRLRYAGDWLGIVTDREKHMKGYAWAHYEPANAQVTIESLYVAPEHRQQGCATELKQQIEKWSKSKGARQIIGTVQQSNQAMLQLNEALGYRVEKYIMSKSLEEL